MTEIEWKGEMGMYGGKFLHCVYKYIILFEDGLW